MELLNYEVLKKSGYEGYILESAPEKVMQVIADANEYRKKFIGK